MSGGNWLASGGGHSRHLNSMWDRREASGNNAMSAKQAAASNQTRVVQGISLEQAQGNVDELTKQVAAARVAFNKAEADKRDCYGDVNLVNVFQERIDIAEEAHKTLDALLVKQEQAEAVLAKFQAAAAQSDLEVG